MEHTHSKTPGRCHEALESKRVKVACLSEKGKNSWVTIKGSCTAEERDNVANEK
jgi:hypothetical protein